MKPALSEPAARAAGAGPAPAGYAVSVRNLCAFAARQGDLDLRFTPSPTAQQGRQGHQLVAQRRAPGHETEVELSGHYKGLHVRGRADGYDAARGLLEEIKTFRGEPGMVAPNQQALHWAQLKVYGWLMCQSRALEGLTLNLVYFDVLRQTEHPLSQVCTAHALQQFFASLCERFLGWARQEQAHRAARDAALERLAFPQKPFRPGQRELAGAVYRACLAPHRLLVQAPTGIGKTIGTVFPALRAMPGRGVDKVFYLTAKTPGRQVALDALRRLRGAAPAQGAMALRVVELVAKDTACEHRDKACHGASCPLAAGFYDRLPAARQAAAAAAWLDRRALRTIALAHGVCPYYLGHEMLRWSDVVVGDYNYYFDRSAMLYALTVEGSWRVSVLVDEAHNLLPRACGMYSADLTHAETVALRHAVGPGLRARVDELLNQWQLLLQAGERRAPDTPWSLLEEPPQAWSRALQRLTGALAEHLQAEPGETHAALLPFYFRALGFAALADAFGDHSLCEFDRSAAAAAGRQASVFDTTDGVAGRLALRNIVPAPFIASRIAAADSLVLFSATLNPPQYYTNMLGLPEATQLLDIPSPFQPEQLAVSIRPISTRRDRRGASLDPLVLTLATQYRQQVGNYLAFFSSFDYLEMAFARMRERHADIPVWAQARQMDEAARGDFLLRFDAAGSGIGFAVLGGVFGEGVDLPGSRLVGAFVATLGLPQFDQVNEAICARLQQRFGRGHDYTYVFPGLQRVVQAAGRVIRSETDTGCVILLDERYLEPRYRALLPPWWKIGAASHGGAGAWDRP